MPRARKKALGRPAKAPENKTKPVYVGLDPHVLGALDALAVSERRPRASMAALLLEEALRARKKLE